MARNDLIIILNRGGGGLNSLQKIPGLIAAYFPLFQVQQGTTGQTLVDYSGKGNNALLGSTSDADTNDPTWGDSYLTFNGIDQYISGGPTAAATLSLLGDPYGNALGWVQGKRTNVAGRLYAELRFSRKVYATEYKRIFSNVKMMLKDISGTFYEWAYPIPCTAGTMDFSITNATNLLWVSPDGATSTAARPQFTHASQQTSWAFCSNWSADNLQIIDNATEVQYIGNVADIPPVITYYVSIAYCSNVTGDITNIRPSYYANFRNCSNVTGDITNIRPSYLASFASCPNVTGDITNIRPSYYANFQNCYNVTGTLNPQPTLQYIYLQGTGLTTTQLDNSIIAVANVTTVVGTFNWSLGKRSTASDAAYDTLATKGWALTAREW